MADSTLTPGTKAIQASNSSNNSTEQYYAHMESERNWAKEEYFSARPQLMATRTERALFRAGFERAYSALWNKRPTIETRADPACIDCIELKNALAAAVGVANEARECHDRDQDMRVMKLLMALAGHVPKYRADTDHIHDVLRRAVERLTSPAHAQECDFAQGECTCGADLAAGERNRAALKALEEQK